MASQLGAVKRWMYRGNRPHLLAAVMNRAWALLGTAGLWPSSWATIEVRGRRTGRAHSFPVVIAEHQGERYLVSMLGEKANWVANVRADGGRAVIIRRGRHPVRLEEVPVESRPPILKRYLRVAPGARPHIPVDRRAPLSEFERIAADFPAFRLIDES